MKLTRRDFIKSAAASAAGVALTGLLGGCASGDTTTAAESSPEAVSTSAQGISGETTASMAETTASMTETTAPAAEPTTVNPGAGSVTPITETVYSTASWRIKPEPIAQSEITETYDVDVCVVGLGHAGAATAVHVAECGYSVIGLEKQLQDMFRTTGNDMGHINSKVSESVGGGSGYDPVEWYNNWMLNTANAANPTLAMKFAQNSGEAIDWWYEKTNGETEPKLVFAPANEERPHIMTEVGPFHFYCSSVNFDDTFSILNSKETIEANDANSRFLFGYAGAQLLQDASGAVTGVVAYNVESGEYIQVNAKAVVLATGGFGGNQEMANDLLVDLKYSLQPNDAFNIMGMDRSGDGIQMGYWVGGRMEQNPATMDGRASWQTSFPARVPMLSHPQGIHLDYTGRRFYNEYWGPIEMRSRPLASRNRDLFYAVFDDNLPDYMQYVPASHGTTNPTAETLAGVREIMNAAYAVKGAGYADETSKSVWYAGDSIEEIVAAMGLSDKVAANVVASVNSWNQCVAGGVDSQYGREAQFLFPIEKGPFYIQVNENNIMLGNFLVTLGGLIVDGDQRVLGEDWMPINGLFATGNTTGGRFGWDYFSPSYGVSVGMAVTLGRECGKSVAQMLEGELV